MATETKTMGLPVIAPSKGGISVVYSESTKALGEIFGTLGTLATAGRMLAQGAEEQAALTRIENSRELLKAAGIEATGIEALVTANQLVAYIRSVR